jgi:hypothetical protein
MQRTLGTAQEGRVQEADADRASQGRWPRICERLAAVRQGTARCGHVR